MAGSTFELQQDLKLHRPAQSVCQTDLSSGVMMRRSILILLALCAFTICASAQSETRYVPVLRLLTTTGEYKTYIIKGPYPDGLSRTECELRLEAWESEHG